MGEWKRTRLKHLAAIPITTGVGLPAEHQNPDWPRYIRTTDIAGPQALRGDVFYSQPPELLEVAGVQSGDLLMTAAGSVGQSYLHTSSEAAVYAGYLARFRPRPDVDPRFIAYWAQSTDFWRQIEVGAVRSTIDNFSAGRYRNLELVVPSPDVQTRIADFLDRETQRIDQARRELERLQALVEERRFAAIVTAVSEAAPNRRRLSLVAKLGTGHTPDRSKPAYWEDCTIPWVTATDLSSRAEPFERLMETTQHVSELGVANSAAVVHPPGTVMLCRTASVGLICRIGVPMATTQDFVTWTPGPELDSEYLMFCLVSMRQEWIRLKFGSTHNTIYFPDIQSVSIPFCSLDVQREVVARIWEQLDVFKALPAELKVLESLLLERRQALITAAVTGQLEMEAVA
jgi:type I restriction enzyme S subunit